MVNVLNLFNQRRDTIEMLVRLRHLPDAFQLTQRFYRHGVFFQRAAVGFKAAIQRSPQLLPGGELLAVEIDQIFTIFTEIQKLIGLTGDFLNQGKIFFFAENGIQQAQA